MKKFDVIKHYFRTGYVLAFHGCEKHLETDGG
jgi:hypothetical protein